VLADTIHKNVPTDRHRVSRADGLRRKAYLVFLVAAIAILALGAYAIGQAGNHIHQTRLISDITATLTAEEIKRVDTTAITRSFRTMQTYLVVLTAGVLFVMLAAILVFIEKVAKPIDQMGAAADKIARGQLSALAPVDGNGEIGRIADLINDMAMNLQEILLLVWNYTGRNRQRLEGMAEMLKRHSNGDALPEGFAERLTVLQREVEDLQSFVEAFDYYDIRLAYGKAQAATDRKTPVPS